MKYIFFICYTIASKEHPVAMVVEYTWWKYRKLHFPLLIHYMPTFVGRNFTSFINIKSITFARVMGHFWMEREIYSFSEKCNFLSKQTFSPSFIFENHSFHNQLILKAKWNKTNLENVNFPMNTVIHVDTHLLNTSFIKIRFLAHLEFFSGVFIGIC